MTEEWFDDESKSKSQIKHEMHELQALGEALIELPDSIYETFPVPEELDTAIRAARKINSHGARRRQLQLIGKIMRNIDSEPIAEAYQSWKTGRKKLAREHQQLEQLREELLTSNRKALEELLLAHPGCDIQQLRQLIRLAQQEQAAGKPPKYYRKLFQFLKDLPS